MLTTITTTTITAMQAGSLGIVATVLLIMLLATKELAISSEGVKARLLGRYTNIAILPLLFTFAVIVAIKTVEVLT